MRRQRSKQFELNLDSLLDTMFNVVGVLIILLVLVQLEADRAISAAAESDEDGINLIQTHSELKDERNTLGELVDEYERLTSEVDKLHQQLASLPPAPELDPIAAQVRQLQTEDARATAQVNAMQTTLDDARRQVQFLTEQINELPVHTSPELRLPKLHPAPPDATTHFWICRNGLIYDAELPEVDLDAEIHKALGLAEGVNIDNTSDSARRVDEYLSGRHYTSRNVELSFATLSATSILPIIMTADLRDNAVGESRQQIGQSNSVYARTIAGYRAADDICSFIVWSDSFEVYLTARNQLDDAGLSAGWLGMAPDEEIQELIGFGVTGGGPLID